MVPARTLLAWSAWLLVALALRATPARAVDQPKLAVLEFEVAKDIKVDRIYFSDKVRGAVGKQAPDLFVMTRESTDAILKGYGKSLADCAGECEVEVGRKLSADYVISGRITKPAALYRLTMRLHSTADGRLLGAEEAKGKDADELADATDEAIARLLGPIAGRTGASPVGGTGTTTPPPPVPQAGGETVAPQPSLAAQGTLKVLSTPSGAKVSVDGDAAGSTPLSVKRDAGTYVVTIELPGYAPANKQVEVASGKAVVVNEALMQAAGYIEVGVQPEAAARAARVTVDGHPAGVGKQGPYKVGKHAVRAEAAGYRAAEQQAAVDNGGTAQVQLVLEALPGKLLLSVNVAASCSVGAAQVQATPDGVAKLEVAAGSARVTCAADGYEDASADVEVGPGKAQAVKLALKRVAGPVAGKVRVEPKSGLEFVAIPAGTFHMGCEPQDKDCDASEKPGKTVSVGAFWLGKTAATVAAFARCAAAGACESSIQGTDTPPRQWCNWKNGRMDHPMNCLNWEEARKFCAWIGGRLPTVEEWEYAAKGGESRIFPWGNEPWSARRANVCDRRCHAERPDLQYFDDSQDDGYAATSPVGAFPAGASKWGLLDMAGNVWQWTSTDYNASNKEPRGGGWLNPPGAARASGRGAQDPSRGGVDIGFRCGLSKVVAADGGQPGHAQ